MCFLLIKISSKYSSYFGKPILNGNKLFPALFIIWEGLLHPEQNWASKLVLDCWVCEMFRLPPHKIHNNFHSHDASYHCVCVMCKYKY